uniref:Cadherin domain-containing protein n=1 Tax=Tetraodon nigroviridis TaxID=99883 RepID=H3C6G7_TETNG
MRALHNGSILSHLARSFCFHPGAVARHSIDLSSKTEMLSPVLLLLPLLFSAAGGKDLEEQKGPFRDIQLVVAEAAPVPYALYQFLVPNHIDSFRLSGEGKGEFEMSSDGWLYVQRPLDWSREDHYVMMIEALAGDQVVDGPVYVTVSVLDINNNPPSFNQSVYTAWVRERTPAGVPFTHVFAEDKDDPTTPNAALLYTLVSQIPSRSNVPFFQIDPETGAISTTEEGQQMLKAREGIRYSRGEEQTIETLRTKFNSYCPVQNIPYEQNPFYTCVERAELRKRNVDPLSDPDYTLIVRAQDLGGKSNTALSGNTRVQIVVLENLWVNPGPLVVMEHLAVVYPLVIAKGSIQQSGSRLHLNAKRARAEVPLPDHGGRRDPADGGAGQRRQEHVHPCSEGN